MGRQQVAGVPPVILGGSGHPSFPEVQSALPSPLGVSHPNGQSKVCQPDVREQGVLGESLVERLDGGDCLVVGPLRIPSRDPLQLDRRLARRGSQGCPPLVDQGQRRVETRGAAETPDQRSVVTLPPRRDREAVGLDQTTLGAVGGLVSQPRSVPSFGVAQLHESGRDITL